MKKIKFKDLFLIKEDTLRGIDELVYNPVTGNPYDDFDKGADGGIIKDKITWPNHDDHLHIGTTNRDVMMELINKAQKMGLSSTENPYAKNDPNSIVDKVHATGSFHYKTFHGEPLVGAGVDISGDRETLRQFIRWINTNYKGKQFQIDATVESPEAPKGAAKPSIDQTSSSTTRLTSSVPSSDEDVKRAYGFMTPFLSSLEPIKKQMQDKLTQKESFTSDNKIINEVERIKNIMKL